jgi:hypothetical protein
MFRKTQPAETHVGRKIDQPAHVGREIEQPAWVKRSTNPRGLRNRPTTREGAGSGASGVVLPRGGGPNTLPKGPNVPTNTTIFDFDPPKAVQNIPYPLSKFEKCKFSKLAHAWG